MDQGYMSPEDLMHGFFDGGIEPDQESALFAELGRNPELRRQFNEHQKIRSSLKYYGGQLTAPAAATSQLFTRLGMNAPVSAVPTPIPPAAGAAAASTTWSNRRSAVLYGITAILAVLVTLVTLVNVGDDTGGALESTSSDFASLTPARTLDADAQLESSQERVAGGLETLGEYQSQSLSEPQDAQLSAVGSTTPNGASESAEAWSQNSAATDNSGNTQALSNAGGSSAAALVSDARAQAANAAANDANNSRAEAAVLSEGVLLSATLPSASSPNTTPNSPSVSQFDPLAFPAVVIPDARRFKFRVNYIGGVSSPDVASSSAAPELENSQSDQNVSIDLLYSISPDWTLGLTYGREQFGQVFRFRDADNRLLEYRQNPMIDWGGLTARFSPERLRVADFVTPYVEMQAGYGTTNAFLGRFTAGASARFFNLVELDMAWHYSELLYSIPGGTNSSQKRGLHLGFSYALF